MTALAFATLTPTFLRNVGLRRAVSRFVPRPGAGA